MITINNKIYENNKVKVTFGNYSVVQNGKKRNGKSPFISFECNGLYIGIELTYDEKWLIELKENDKKDITKFVSDIIYEDQKGFISLILGKYACYLERINDCEYKIELICETEEGSEIFIININEIITINCNN